MNRWFHAGVWIASSLLLSGCAGMSANHHNRLGLQAFEQQKYLNACLEFQQSVDRNPSRADSRLMLGWSQYHLSRTESALALFQSVSILKGLHKAQYADAFEGMARCWYRLGDPIRAYETMISCEKLQRLSADQERLAGWAAFAADRKADAISHFTRASTMRTADAEAQYGLALCALSEGRHEDAIRHASRSIRWDASSAGSYIVRAEASLALNRIEDAIRDFNSALDRDPGSAIARDGLARATGVATPRSTSDRIESPH